MKISVAFSEAYLAESYRLMGEAWKAQKCIDETLKKQMESGLPYILRFIQNVKGKVYFDLGDMKTAQSSIEEGLKQSKELQNGLIKGLCSINLGGILRKTDPKHVFRAEVMIQDGI